MEIITLLPDQPLAIDDSLAMTVQLIVEEWLPPYRRPVLIVGVLMRTPETEEVISFTSEQSNLIWEDYEFKYLGGWCDEVRLQRVRRNDRSSLITNG